MSALARCRVRHYLLRGSAPLACASLSSGSGPPPPSRCSLRQLPMPSSSLPETAVGSAPALQDNQHEAIVPALVLGSLTALFLLAFILFARIPLRDPLLVRLSERARAGSTPFARLPEGWSASSRWKGTRRASAGCRHSIRGSVVLSHTAAVLARHSRDRRDRALDAAGGRRRRQPGERRRSRSVCAVLPAAPQRRAAAARRADVGVRNRRRARCARNCRGRGRSARAAAFDSSPLRHSLDPGSGARRDLPERRSNACEPSRARRARLPLPY